MCVLTISKMYLRVAFNLSGSFFTIKYLSFPKTNILKIFHTIIHSKIYDKNMLYIRGKPYIQKNKPPKLIEDLLTNKQIHL